MSKVTQLYIDLHSVSIYYITNHIMNINAHVLYYKYIEQSIACVYFIQFAGLLLAYFEGHVCIFRCSFCYTLIFVGIGQMSS